MLKRWKTSDLYCKMNELFVNEPHKCMQIDIFESIKRRINKIMIMEKVKNE